MISINSISDVYDIFQSKKLSGNHELKIFLKSSSAYDQFYNLVYDSTEGNKKTKTCTARALSRLLFFVHFSNCLGIYEIPNYILRANITSNKEYLLKYRKKLGFIKPDEELALMSDEDREKEENDIKYNMLSTGRRYYYENDLLKSICSYSINFNITNLDMTSDVPKELTFIINKNEDFNKYITKISNYCLFEYDNFKPEFKFSEKDFLKLYSKLVWYIKLENGEMAIDEYKTSLSIEHPAHFSGNRFYHPFHGESPENRESLVKLDNELLVSAYDVHNAYLCFISILLNRKVPVKEANRFEERALAGLLYEDLMDHVYYKFGKTWDRDTAKRAMLIFCSSPAHKLYNKHNTPRKNHFCAVEVDDFFTQNYPNIKKFILGKNKDSTSVHKFIREKESIETKIMVHGICKRLFEEYHIIALTLHDGIYIKKSDMDKLNDYNISIENMFKEYILLKHFMSFLI